MARNDQSQSEAEPVSSEFNSSEFTVEARSSDFVSEYTGAEYTEVDSTSDITDAEMLVADLPSSEMASTELALAEAAPAQSGRFASMSDDGQLERGELVGEYVVDKPIGTGGMGTVYRATHKIIGKHAAVKVLHQAAGIRQASRLIAEARAVNQICHKNIVDVFDFGVLHDGRPFVVMELLSGMPLDARLVKGQPISVIESLRIIAPIISALQAAHKRGIVHRDLKPANIFMLDTEGGEPGIKLLDFGIAKFLDTDANQGLTSDGMVLGTLAYLAPEIASGKDISVHADTYSLGVMLYQMLVGKLPFVGQNSLETLYAHVHTPPPTPTDQHVKLPAALEALLLRMLSKKPKDRPKLSEVADFALHYSERAESQEYVEPLLLDANELKAKKRRRMTWIAGAGVAFAAVVTGLLSMQRTSDPDTSAKELPAMAAPSSEQLLTPSPAVPALEIDLQQPSALVQADAAVEIVSVVNQLVPDVQELPTAKEGKPRRERKANKRRRRTPKNSGRKSSDDAPIDPLKGLR